MRRTAIVIVILLAVFTFINAYSAEETAGNDTESHVSTVEQQGLIL